MKIAGVFTFKIADVLWQNHTEITQKNRAVRFLLSLAALFLFDILQALAIFSTKSNFRSIVSIKFIALLYFNLIWHRYIVDSIYAFYFICEQSLGNNRIFKIRVSF